MDETSRPPLTDAEREERKAAAIAARRAAMPAHLRHHIERRNREREARAQRKAYRQAQAEAAVAAEPRKTCTGCKQSLPLSAFHVRKKSGKPIARCKPCHSAQALACYYARTGRPGDATGVRSGRPSASAARRAEVAATWAAYHSLRLEGLIPSDPVVDEEDWELTTQAVRQGWERGGDKECIGCKQTVPPSAMLPPGPGNFYPGRCQPCARLARREGHFRVFGSYPAETPRLIPMRDGTEITIGELARRHRERTARRRATRYARRFVS